jgi:hypothetical protein
VDLTNRERFLRLMHGEAVDRAPFFPCFGPWPQTLARWQREGLPEDGDWQASAGFDGALRHKLSVNAYLCPAFERRVLSQEGDTQIVVDQRGVTKRERDDGWSYEFLAHPVIDHASWEQIKPRLHPDVPGRFPADRDAFCARHVERNDPVYASA